MRSGESAVSLSRTQRSVLEFLDRCDGGQARICAACIAASTATERPAVERALAGLCDRGLVEETPGVAYRITASGRSHLTRRRPQPA